MYICLYNKVKQFILSKRIWKQSDSCMCLFIVDPKLYLNFFFNTPILAILQEAK